MFFVIKYFYITQCVLYTMIKPYKKVTFRLMLGFTLSKILSAKGHSVLLLKLNHSELIQSVGAQGYKLCGSNHKIEVYHIRKLLITQLNQFGILLWRF